MTLHITEFSNIGHIAGTGDVQAPRGPVAYQNIVLGGVNQQSALVNASTRMVRVVSSVAAFICIGANPNALSGIKIYLPAGVPEYFMVTPGVDKVAGVTA